MSDVYNWLFFHKKQVLSGCALLIVLLVVLIIFIHINASTKEALKEYERPPASTRKRPLPWAKVIYY